MIEAKDYSRHSINFHKMLITVKHLTIKITQPTAECAVNPKYLLNHLPYFYWSAFTVLANFLQQLSVFWL